MGTLQKRENVKMQCLVISGDEAPISPTGAHLVPDSDPEGGVRQDLQPGHMPICLGNRPERWQARKEQDRNMRAGLIPSRALQERRIVHERNEQLKDNPGQEDLARCAPSVVAGCAGGIGAQEGLNGALTPSGITHGGSGGANSASKTKKIMYDLAENDDFDREEIATYEEVARIFPRPGQFRPVVLIGPPGVGRNELKRRLMALDNDRYKATVPHTSRPSRPGEIHGKDYFFDTREQMQIDVEAGKFIEHGEYRGNLYGTSTDGVRDLIASGLQPIVSPHYQALKMLRTPELKPFIVYVKAPPFDRLKETRHSAFARSTFDETSSRSFTDEEFYSMVKAGTRIEQLYSHWFDLTIVNEDLGAAFEQLVRAVRRLDQDAHWVPASWVQ